MSKHTPGPWVKNEYGELIPKKSRQVGVWGLGVNNVYRSEEAEANARLIAAAPDLLEALEQLIDFLEPIRFERNSDDKRAISLDIAARAAIAKARGEA